MNVFDARRSNGSESGSTGSTGVPPSVPGAEPAPAAWDAGDGLSEAVYIEGCSGWLHRPADGLGRETAVVLCPGLAWDGLVAHHSLRLLAERLASAGYSTLRFSYPGCGDSRELSAAEGSDPWGAWLESVRCAADWLRGAAGCRKLVLAGVRLGATLAALAAEGRDDVAGLLLMAPVLRGRSFMRQLAIEAQLESGAAARADGLDFHEMAFDAAQVARIGLVDLQHAQWSPGLKIGLFGAPTPRLAASCAEAWVAAGAEVVACELGGLAPLLQQTIHGEPSALDGSAVLGWLSAACPLRSPPSRLPPLGGQPSLRLPGATERPLRFGPDDRLAGVLCQPDGAADWAVVIGNSGRDPHQGVGRFGVVLARRLAAIGIASFRIDFAGLGDSAGPPGREDRLSPLFDADRSGDIAAALDVLQAWGYRRFAVQGLCSGAYHAFRAALADTRVDALLMVNLPVFEWRAGDTVESVARDLAPPTEYLAKIVSGDLWRRLVRGDVALGRIIRSRAARAMRGLARFKGTARVPSAPQWAMAALSARGVQSLFLFGEGDAGLNAVEQAFGRRGAALHSLGGVTMQTAPGFDHVLSMAGMREEAAERIAAFLQARTLVPADRSGSGCVPPTGEGALHDGPRDDHRPGGDYRRPARQDAGAAD